MSASYSEYLVTDISCLVRHEIPRPRLAVASADATSLRLYLWSQINFLTEIFRDPASVFLPLLRKTKICLWLHKCLAKHALPSLCDPTGNRTPI